MHRWALAGNLISQRRREGFFAVISGGTIRFDFMSGRAATTEARHVLPDCRVNVWLASSSVFFAR
jgi:hypothetical protein